MYREDAADKVDDQREKTTNNQDLGVEWSQQLRTVATAY